MFTRPDDLVDADIVRSVADGWGVRASTVEWAAVGFGSHHWQVTGGQERWFVTVDDLDARQRDASDTRAHAAARLSAALSVARTLRDAGLDFVIAPSPTRSGDIVHPIDDRYVVALYEHVDGEAHPWGAYPTRPDRLAVLDRIVAVHNIAPLSASMALREDFAIPRRDRLLDALSDRRTPWGPGRFAEDARALLHEHDDATRRVLTRYDQLVVELTSRLERMVLTHGEPHRGNTINTSDGVVLIDWDTTLLAPPERDLWMLIDEDVQMANDYAERTGTLLDHATIQLYRLRWDLCEISCFITDFRRPHEDTGDTRVAWDNLQCCLNPVRWRHLL